MVFTWRVLNALFLSSTSTGKCSAHFRVLGNPVNSVLSVPGMRGPLECSHVIVKITTTFFSSLILKPFGKEESILHFIFSTMKHGL